ncbi:hypothetical protein [Actinokineospora sp. UTMC 2448]|uniref:hypothetical protein n=1 Tax=Actinokineospora sp. UTMC 2448 TaxID=2268449 RepID=UPI002869448C|nr:hypothetical protein [Actinokineospora sp. UTMC 2448]
MWNRVMAMRWRRGYLRVVRSSFATVPFYRELWALSGRTEPEVVPGRTGVDGGAVRAAALAGRVGDLVPLAGGPTEIDPLRGLGPVLAEHLAVTAGTLVAVVDPGTPRPPVDLPAGVRSCVLDPSGLAGPYAGVLDDVADHLRRGGRVVAVGGDKDLDQLAAALPETLAHLVTRVPVRGPDDLTAPVGPHALIAHPLLGVLGGLGGCGRWHIDHPRVYLRATPAGPAYTLLRQRSPRLVDVLAGHGRPGWCPRHGTPVVEP